MEKTNKKELLSENEFEKEMRIDELDEEVNKLKKQIIPITFGLGILVGAMIINSFSINTAPLLAPLSISISTSCPQVKVEKEQFNSASKAQVVKGKQLVPISGNPATFILSEKSQKMFIPVEKEDAILSTEEANKSIVFTMGVGSKPTITEKDMTNKLIPEKDITRNLIDTRKNMTENIVDIKKDMTSSLVDTEDMSNSIVEIKRESEESSRKYREQAQKVSKLYIEKIEE